MPRPLMLAAVLVASAVAFTDVAFAQKSKPSSVNAALKARDSMRDSYRQSGTIAGGYRPLSAWSYRNSARVQTQALTAYGESCPQVAPATAKEHLAEIQRNLDASAKELEKFSDEAAREADVKQHVDKIREHQSAALAKCVEMEQAIGKETVDCAELCACCASIDQELKAAEQEHRKLLEKVGIPPPGAKQKDQKADAPAKPDTPQGERK